MVDRWRAGAGVRWLVAGVMKTAAGRLKRKQKTKDITTNDSDTAAAARLQQHGCSSTETLKAPLKAPFSAATRAPFGNAVTYKHIFNCDHFPM